MLCYTCNDGRVHIHHTGVDTMKRLLAIVLPALLALVTHPLPAQGQDTPRIRKIVRGDPALKRAETDEALVIPEVSAMISEEGGNVVIDHILEPGMRAKGYEKT